MCGETLSSPVAHRPSPCVCVLPLLGLSCCANVGRSEVLCSASQVHAHRLRSFFLLSPFPSLPFSSALCLLRCHHLHSSSLACHLFTRSVFILSSFHNCRPLGTHYPSSNNHHGICRRGHFHKQGLRNISHSGGQVRRRRPGYT
jgi:hypothetical protein